MKTTLSKEVLKNISKNEYYSEQQFIDDCKTYIKAVKSGRILYTVTNVSKSGMSRTINIKSYEGTMKSGYYRQYSSMLEALGYPTVNWSDIRVSGCGMDMLFYTNYNTIHQLHRMGFMNKKSCDTLAQRV